MGIFNPGGGGGTTLPVVDTQTIVKGSGDPTKLMRFEVDGQSAGVTRVISTPDGDILLIDASDGLIGAAQVKSDVITGHVTVTAASGDFVLISDTGDAGNLKKVDANDFLGGASPPFADTTSLVEGSGDPTKEIRFEVDGITTGTVRVITPPDSDIALVETVDGQIRDANIAAHTSTKITITAKPQLNGAIVYNDQSNVFGDFDQSLRSGRLRISNPANTFFYIFIGSAIAADRNITIPLMVADGEMMIDNASQTITNKIITAAANAITMASTDLTDTAQIVLTSKSNIYGDFDQVFQDDRIRIMNPAGTFAYTIQAGALVAGAIARLPLFADDTFVMLNLAQTLSGKVIDSAANTLTVDLSEATVSGTAAEFDSACSDDDFAFLSAANTFTGANIIDNATGLTWNNQGAGGDPILLANDAAQKLDLTGSLDVSGTVQEGGVDISPIGPHDISFNAAAFKSRTTGGVASGQLDSRELPTNDIDIEYFEFTNAGGVQAIQSRWFSLPRNFDNANIDCYIWWTGASGSGDVAWKVRLLFLGDSDPLDSALGVETEIVDTFILADDVHVSPTGTLTVTGSADNDMCLIQVQRDPGDAQDTYSGDAQLMIVKLVITTDAATAA